LVKKRLKGVVVVAANDGDLHRRFSQGARR
jgi:hypothetical protein